MQENEQIDEVTSVTTFQVMMSVIASILGVQNRAAYERDFKYGKPGQFIIVAIVMTVAFIGFVYGLVQFAFYYFGV